MAELLSILAMAQKTPEPNDFVLPELRRGKLGFLCRCLPLEVGLPIPLQMAFSVANAEYNSNTLSLDITKSGEVLYLALEPRTPELHAMVYQQSQTMPDGVLASIDKNVTILHPKDRTFNILDDTLFSELLAQAQGKRLVVIDSLTRLGADGDYEELHQVGERLNDLAVESGAAVLCMPIEKPYSFGDEIKAALAFSGWRETVTDSADSSKQWYCGNTGALLDNRYLVGATFHKGSRNWYLNTSYGSPGFLQSVQKLSAKEHLNHLTRMHFYTVIG